MRDIIMNKNTASTKDYCKSEFFDRIESIADEYDKFLKALVDK
jgi:hypothetical protein